MGQGLPIGDLIEFGFITGFEDGISISTKAELAMQHGYDSVWVGDHVVCPVPMLDSFQQLAQLAALTEGVTLGTAVYILPLRHPVQAAKQATSLDHLCEGRFVFGVGLGGDFPEEWAACEVPVEERGPRMSTSLPLIRTLMCGEPTQAEGPFYHFPETQLVPAAYRDGGPPLWIGGFAPAALKRIAHFADGWIGYMKTPAEYTAGLQLIAEEAESCGRAFTTFGAAHLLSVRIESTREEALEAARKDVGYAMAEEMGIATPEHVALGSPADVAERMESYRQAGVRHFIIETLGFEERTEQLARFAEEVRPLL